MLNLRKGSKVNLIIPFSTGKHVQSAVVKRVINGTVYLEEKENKKFFLTPKNYLAFNQKGKEVGNDHNLCRIKRIS